MGKLYLPILIRQQPRFRSLQHPQPAALESRRVPARDDPFAARLDAHHLHMFILEEGMKQPDRIAPAAHAGHEQIRQPFLLLQNLRRASIPITR